MEIRINESLHVKNPTPTIEKWCRENLILDNPEYYKREQMGKWTGNVPRSIWLYERVGDELILPFGCLQEIWKLCVRGLSWKLEIGPIREVKYNSSINLYSYQETAVTKALAAKNGVLVMPCGSGKTQSGLEVIARVGGKALWLTHTQDLLNQSRKRAESVFNGAGFGSITAGKVDIGTHITFATVQTMAKLDLSKYRECWDIIIVDECQHCAGSPTRVTQFYKVVSNLCARYKIGLTATPKRGDGLERSMFMLLGGVIHEVDRSEVKNTTCPIVVKQVETGWMPDYDCILMGDGTIDYHRVVDNMIQDSERFNVVISALAKLPKHVPIIVLANRVEYLQRLCNKYNDFELGKGVCISGSGQSIKAKSERKEVLQKLNDGDLDCIFATYQLAKEGLDVPNLKYILFATPEQDETTIIQAAGRVGRKAQGKTLGTVIDFTDNFFGMYKGWWNKRLRYYRKIGAELV